MDGCKFLVLQPQHCSGCPGCRLLGSVYAKHKLGQTDRTRHRASMVQISDRLPLPALWLYLLPDWFLPFEQYSTLSPSESGTDTQSFPLGRCIAGINRHCVLAMYLKRTCLISVSTGREFFFSSTGIRQASTFASWTLLTLLHIIVLI